jgi:ComF family protein
VSVILEEWKFSLLDLIAPPGCAGCGVLGVPFCFQCLAHTRLIQKQTCRICGAAAAWEGLCEACALLPPLFRRASSFAVYEDPFKKVVMALKYQGDRSLGHFISQAAAPGLISQGWPVEIGVPVPLGKERRRTRGYNQVDLFAEPLSRQLSIPYAPRALSRIQETRSQVGLSMEERRYNLRTAFQAYPQIVSGKNVLLYDDVFTSGTTANECAGALLDAGASNVFVFTLARAVA